MGIGNANRYEEMGAQRRWENARAQYPEHEYGVRVMDDGTEWFVQRSTGQPVAPCPTAPEQKPLGDLVKFTEGPRNASQLQVNPRQSEQRSILNNVSAVDPEVIRQTDPQTRRALRARTGVSVAELAAITGLPERSIEAYESGQADPDALMGAAYAKYLSASYGEAVANGEVE